MISLKDYAAQKNVSYEAVRKQVTRYKEDLEGHIVLDGRQQFLDDEAVAFLDSKRQKNPVIIYQQSKDDEIATLKEEREQLILKVAAQAERIADLTQFKLETIEKRQAIEAATAQQALREQALIEREASITQELAEARQEAAEAAQREVEEKIRQEVARVRLEAERAQEDAAMLHENALAARDRRIQELENRTFSDYLKGLFRRK